MGCRLFALCLLKLIADNYINLQVSTNILSSSIIMVIVTNGFNHKDYTFITVTYFLGQWGVGICLRTILFLLHCIFNTDSNALIQMAEKENRDHD